MSVSLSAEGFLKLPRRTDQWVETGWKLGCMNQPWGLSGPQFTILYFVGYIGAMMVVFAVHALLTRTDVRAADTGTPLDVDEVAYLTGGPNRVVETAIAGLALREQILVARQGRLTAVRDATPFGPVEAAVCHELARASTASKTRVLFRMRGHPSVEAIGDQARSRGLLLDPFRARVWRLVLGVPVAVWCVGVVRAINGAALGRPIGTLTALLFATALATIILLLARWPRARYQPSAAVRRLRKRQKAAPAADIGVQVAGVAVLGFTALADPVLRNELAGPSRSGGAGAVGGGGCGGGGGGGCGG